MFTGTRFSNLYLTESSQAQRLGIASSSSSWGNDLVSDDGVSKFAGVRSASSKYSCLPVFRFFIFFGFSLRLSIIGCREAPGSGPARVGPHSGPAARAQGLLLLAHEL